MKISPVTGPGVIPPNGTPEHVRTAKAIAAFSKGSSSYDRNTASAQSQTSGAPPVNQNAISAEDVVKEPVEQHSEEVLESVASSEETPAETPKEEVKPEQDPALSRQFAQLARQERALRAQKQQWQTEVKAKEAALAVERATLTQSTQKPDLSNYVSLDDVKRNAWGILAKAGVSYDDITQQAINQQAVNPQVQAHIDALEAKIAKLQETTDNGAKSYAEQQQNNYQAAVRQIEMDVVSLVKSDPIAYEAIAKTGKGSIKEVVKLIEETFSKDGILLSAEEAAEEVENYLVEQSVKTVSQIDKIKKRMAQTNASSKPTDVKTQPLQKQPQPMKTLTNANSSTRKLSARERALLAFKGELKS